MKILLIKPISPSHIIAPPLGLGYLAAALRKAGHEPQMLDCARDGLAWDGLREELRQRQPELIGLQMWSCDYPAIAKTLEIIKEVVPQAVTIVGGAHPSGAPYQVLEQFPELDYAFKGEGEEHFPRFVKLLETGQRDAYADIPGLIYRDAQGQTVVNEQCFSSDLDAIGLPAWDLMAPGSYPEAPHQGFAMAFPIAPIVISRGCPYPCTFCATRTLTGRKIRFRSLDQVIEEIKLLIDEYGVREIHIEDDNFTMNHEYVERFCRRLLDEEIRVWWYCSSGVRLDSLDVELLRLMKQAGCYTVTIAIESGVQRILDDMQKKTTLADIRASVDIINAAGFEPTGLFILGYPTETREDIEATIRFARSLQLKRAQFALFHPLPGSPIYEELKEKGELADVDWAKLKPTETAYAPPGLTVQELKRLQQWAFISFHFRPRILFKQFKEVQSLSHFMFLVRRVADYILGSSGKK